MASTWTGDIPGGSDQGILMAKLKEQSSLFKGNTPGYDIGRRLHVNGFVWIREQPLAPGEQLFCRSSSLPVVRPLPDHATERLESLSL